MRQAGISRLAIDVQERARDDDPAPRARPTRWVDLQWQGVRLLERIAPDRTVARDIRLLRDLENARDGIEVPRPAAVRGVVEVFRQWWAERGDDPSLTHDPSRIPDLGPWMTRLELPGADPDAWVVPRLLADLDADLVLHVRIARRLDPDRHAFLAAELVQSLRTFPEGFVEAGIEARRWDPDTGRTVGHNAGDLWAIGLELLERCTGRAFSGPNDDMRRLADRKSVV